ncbi:hypothetical protein GGR53DRAFT_310580 [Hypoxylon sp. FL1150]|nr:hypothetical protein GGR53DRAFT_310580 [Hypoxylon sp. FL1150]
MEMPELTYPESHTQATHSESTPNLALSSVSHQSNFPAEVAYPQATPAASGKKRNTSASTRRSLPSGHTKQTPVPAPSIPQNTPNWNTSPAPVHATTASPTLTKKQTPKRSRARKSAVTENNQQEHEQGQEQDGMKQAAALSQAAIQTQSRPSPAVESPYLTATRASSRQANRSQTSTPVASTSRPEPQAPPVVTNASYNTTSTTSISNYDPYARYDNSTSSQYANIANDQGSSRIAYEPGSYQPTTGVTTTSMSYSTAPAYNYSQGNRSSNPLSQALNTSTGYTTNSSTTAQWAPPRPSSTQPHTQSQTTNSYSMSSAATAASHGYGAVSSGIRAQHRNAPYNQPQSQPSYGSYTAQQPSTSQQPQADWYRFASTNNSSNANQSSYTRNQTSGYSNTTNSARATSYSTQRYENQDFGARSDDQSLYDLLRASGSTH